MPVIINASTSAGAQIIPDNSGVIQFQSNGANTVQIAANAAIRSSGGGSFVLPSSGVVTVPAGTGNAVINGVNGCLVSATAQASTSGTAIDFTGIPSWAKRITVMFNGVSTSGTSFIQIQIGSGSFVTSGYVSYSGISSQSNNSSTGFGPESGSVTAATLRSGFIILSLLNPSSNLWAAGYSGYGLNVGGVAYGAAGGGTLALAGALDRVRITTVNGTDTFDAGSINIMYE